MQAMSVCSSCRWHRLPVTGQQRQTTHCEARSQNAAAPALPARRLVTCRAAEASQPAAYEEWDIVEYQTPAGPALGRISQVGAGELSIERLEEDAVNSVWLVSHADEERVPLAAVRRTVAADYMQMVDPDRVSNPHGEHALEAYRLLEPVAAAVSEAMRLAAE